VLGQPTHSTGRRGRDLEGQGRLVQWKSHGTSSGGGNDVWETKVSKRVKRMKQTLDSLGEGSF